MKPVLFMLLALCLTAPVVRADAIATIELHNRPADEVIPLVKPMLGPHDAISGQGFLLFLRAPPATQTQVRKMVRTLDVAARTLLISVFQGSDRELRALRIEGGAEVSGEHGSIAIGKRPDDGRGARFDMGTPDTGAGVGVIGTRGRRQDNPIHQLSVTEGTEGYIETGQTIPYFSGSRWIAPGAADSGVTFKNVTTGFYVLPRVHGDRVTLEISPFRQTPGTRRAGDIDVQRAQTTLTGRLGEWLQVGGTSRQTRRTREDTGHYSTTETRDSHSIWIRAELAP